MQSENGALVASVAAVLEQAGVVAGSKLCCGFSGGLDSVVTLALLHRLAPACGFVLEAIHVHHGLSPNADDWARFCADFCARRGIPFQVRWLSLAAHSGQGFEALARRARYAALDERGADWLVLGHHADDQAETLLLNLLRGAGVRGAAGMAAIVPAQRRAGLKRAGRLRPLLARRRGELEAWAQEQGLSWVEDESNAGLAYRRNQLRWRALPVLRESFPGAVTTLARAADHFRVATDLLAELAELDACRCAGTEALHGRSLVRAAALALSDERLFNLLRWLAARAGWQMPSQARLVEAVRQLRSVAVEQPVRVVVGEFACCAWRERLWLEAAVVPPVATLTLARWSEQDWPGRLPWGAGEVLLTTARGTGIALAALQAAERIELGPPRAGLRLSRDQGSGRSPRRSLRKWAQEAGIAAWERARLPVLWLDDEAAWLGGYGVLAGFAAAPAAPAVLPRWLPGQEERLNEETGKDE